MSVASKRKRAARRDERFGRWTANELRVELRVGAIEGRRLEARAIARMRLELDQRLLAAARVPHPKRRS